nr:fibrinopeptide B [Macaca sp.]prf//650770G fibrinopeptide B [Macaca mulatta]
NEESPFSGR